MQQPENNNRETGARKYPAAKPQADETDTHAGMPTANPFGLTEPLDETTEKTRQSDGVDQSKTSPAIEKVAGAGPALAEHSKDAKALKSGRHSGSFIKH
jgi:hypothetical protein